jgi:hypothetical protein
MSIPNTTYRVLVEKLGDSDPSQFIGNEGEVFYDPNNPILKLSNGTTPGGLSVGGEGGDGSETDPLFSVSAASTITNTNISNWNTAYGWGDHTTVGYLTSYTETDPVFSASEAAGIISADISNWDTAYGWGDHSVVGYQTATSTSYAQTLIVDPNGDDTTGNGGPNAPFKTVQAAHDYADLNIPVANQVVVKLNTGSYSGNLLITRPNIHFVGPTQGVSKSTRISGIVTVSTASSVGGAANDMVSFEDILIVSNSGTSAVTIGGTFGCSVMFKDAFVFTSSSTAKCVDVTNTATGGVSVHMKNVLLQNQASSGITLDLSNTYYANIDLLTLFSGTGTSMNITTTDAVVYNTRIEKTGIGTAVIANSSFTAGKPSLILGNATIANPTANSDGILVPSGSTVNIAQVAFNIADGTGFAVKGVDGSVVVNGNNLFVPGTNNKISSAIGAGNIPLTTTFTSA